jgi:TRAP-type mannitol/chloroaromatic compound transport system permease large subunit
MLVLFVLGFVLDFLEIIYIVIPIVGPVIYGGTFDPKWVTIMIAVNLQTSFLTPPFGFALFYLRGVAPKSITTGQIYRGVLPFIGIQVAGLLLLALVPGFVTIVPNLLN